MLGRLHFGYHNLTLHLSIQTQYPNTIFAATHANKEEAWLKTLCSSVGFVHKAIRLDCDSQSAIFLAKNLAYHAKTKHIDVPYHFVRDMVEDK